MEGRSAPPAISPKPGSLGEPSGPHTATCVIVAIARARRGPLPRHQVPPHWAGQSRHLQHSPPVLGPLPPEELELLDPELPLDELGELGPLVLQSSVTMPPSSRGTTLGSVSRVLGVLAETPH